MLTHLNQYWGQKRIEPHTDFYAMSFMFFYYYGLPSHEYHHLQPLAQSIHNQLRLEALNAQSDIQQLNLEIRNLKEIFYNSQDDEHNFNEYSTLNRIDNPIDILENCHYKNPICEIALKTLKNMDLNTCPVERLIKALFSIPPHSFVIDILTKINIPESMQNSLMQLIFENVDDNNIDFYQKLIHTLFPHFTKAQQLFWRTKIKNTFPLLYAWIRYDGEFSTLHPDQAFNDIPAQQTSKELDQLKGNLYTALINDDETAISNLLNIAIAKKFQTLIDYALSFAVSNQRANLIDFILTKKPNLNIIYKGKSLLQITAANSGIGAVIAAKLISAGANVHFKDPLFGAILYKNQNLVEKLLQKYPAKCLIDSFKLALQNEALNIIYLFIENYLKTDRINIETKIFLTTCTLNNLFQLSSQNQTHGIKDPFLAAEVRSHQIAFAGRHNQEVGRYFLYRIFVNPSWHYILTEFIDNIPSEQRDTMFKELLLNCNKNKLITFAEILINYGADITLLDVSIIVSSSLLIEKVCDFHINSKHGFFQSFLNKITPEALFSIVDKRNFYNVIRLMQTLNWDINTQDNHGKTVLHHVCEGKNIPNIADRIIITIHLLKNGINLFTKDKQQFLPEDYLYSESLFAQKSDAEKFKAKDFKASWKSYIKENYQEQLRTKKMQFFVKAKQQNDTRCSLTRLTTDLMKYTFYYVASDKPTEVDKQRVDANFKKATATLTRLYNK